MICGWVETARDRKIIKVMFNASFFVISKPFYFFNIILFLSKHDFRIFASQKNDLIFNCFHKLQNFLK